MPLVGSLENGLLITAVTINTNGPYLFAIDPDAPMTLVDQEVIKKNDYRTFPGPKRLDESDTQQTRFYVELLNMEIGTLIVERRNAIIVRANTFDTAGRRIVGVLGRDVFPDSLVWGFDRDHGLVYQITQKTFKSPEGATAFNYGELESRVTNAQTTPPPRRLVDATVNGEKFAMHVDLGATASQLRESEWPKAKLVARDVKTIAVDEIGFGRIVEKASEPVTVSLGGVDGTSIFIPYGDKRWQSEDIAGTIGLDFFNKHDVWQSWHTKQYFVVPRQPVDAATRIGRWDSAVLSKCKNVGCVSIRITDPLAGKAVEPGKHPGLVMSVTRDEVAGGMGLEVTLEAVRDASAPATPAIPIAPEAPAAPASGAPATPATGAPASPATGAPASPASGAPASPATGAPASPATGAPATPATPAMPAADPNKPLPYLLVNMPGHVDKMLYQLPATFLNSTITVVDASPFPRTCPSQNGCVDQLAR